MAEENKELINRTTLTKFDVNQLIDFLNQIKEDSELRGLLHSESSKCYDKIGKRISFPIVIFSALMSSITAPQLTYHIECGGYNYYLNMVLFGLGVATTTLSTIQNYFNYPKKAEKHCTAALLYAKICRRIRLFLLQEKTHQKTSAELIEFVERIQKEIDNIIDMKLEFPSSIEKKYISFDEEDDENIVLDENALVDILGKLDPEVLKGIMMKLKQDVKIRVTGFP